MQENKDREEFKKKLGIVAKGIINMSKERQSEEKNSIYKKQTFRAKCSFFGQNCKKRLQQ